MPSPFSFPFFKLSRIILSVSFLLLLLSGGLLFYSACAGDLGFEYATPQRGITLPRDLASHNTFQTEWWYYTGHLNTLEGKRFGYELTFFRVSLQEKNEAPKPIFFGHFALSDLDNQRFLYREKQSRGSFGDAGSSEAFYRTHLTNWSVEQLGPYFLLQAATDSLGLTLILEPTKPPVFHGKNGYSQKGADPKNASMYFSYTRLKSVGALMVGDSRYTVEGESWHDHEFGTSQLEPGVVGWDWFSIQFDNHSELMLYQLRLENGTMSPFSSGTAVDSLGNTITLKADDVLLTPLSTYTSKKSGATYPNSWTLSIPRLGMSLEIKTEFNDQELQTDASTRVTYWEGCISVSGKKSEAGREESLRGRGYTELTGYHTPFNANF